MLARHPLANPCEGFVREPDEAGCESVSRDARVLMRKVCEAFRPNAAPPGAPSAIPLWGGGGSSLRVMSAKERK